MRRKIVFLCVVIGLFTLGACRTVYNVEKAKSIEVSQEGTIVFVRPADYKVFGTESLRDYIEITYEEASRNVSGYLQVSIGFRNKGGKHLYDRHGPNFHLSVKTACYDKPFNMSGQKSAPSYETNWKTINLLRGVTEHYKVICPKKSATHYQVTVSEYLK